MKTRPRAPLWAFALLVTLLAGCWWDDDEDYPYLDEDAKGCCRCIGPDCPDGGPEDAGDDGGGE